jgi:prepilin-type N-terminal cleavage/methylation domain-containing protein/prepilin-type processing-associated H-X9-DG protein
MTFVSWKAPLSKTPAAFTLIELLVVIVILGILAAILLPVLSKAKSRALGVGCMNNEKQVMYAFRMYSDDNNDNMVSAQDGGGATSGVQTYYNNRPCFVPGQLDLTTAQYNWNPKVNLTISPLWPFLQKEDVYRCPADPVLINVSAPPAGIRGGQYPRIRSISLNIAFGDGNFLPAGAFKLYSKYGAIDLPAFTFTFIDQQPNNLNDCNFCIQCGPPAIVDLVGPFHSGGHGSGISFADGHSELHTWLGREIDPPYIPLSSSQSAQYDNWNGVHPSFTAADQADVNWLANHTTVAGQ